MFYRFLHQSSFRRLLMQIKISTFFLLSAGATLYLPLAIASDDASQKIATLMKIVQKQQQEIELQGREIQHLSIQLESYTKQKSHVLPQPSSNHKPQVDSSKKISRVDIVKVYPEQESVLTQASYSEDSVSIPYHSLVLGDHKSNLSLFGQINELSFFAYDGQRGHLLFGTNSNSNSRLNINSQFNPVKNFKIGSDLQFGFRVNPSLLLSQTNTSTSSIEMRRVQVYSSSPYFGMLYLGKGETASDNTAYSDLSGTVIVARSSVNDIGGGLFFRDRATGQLSSVTVNNTINALDGFSRRNRIRYDTPSFGGLSLSGSLISGDREDIALKFGHAFNQTKLAAQVAYTSARTFNDGTVNEARGNELDGSASILFPVGISLTGAGGLVMAEEAGREDPSYYYVKGGYQKQFWKVGLTAVSVDAGQYYNFAEDKDIATTYGVQFLQNITPWELVAYMGYRFYALHRPGSSFDHLNVVLAGAMYKF